MIDAILKLIFVSDREKWEAQRTVGRDALISPLEKEILDALSIVDQKADFAKDMSIRTHNLLVILIIILLGAIGPLMLKVVRGQIVATPAVATAPAAPAPTNTK